MIRKSMSGQQDCGIFIRFYKYIRGKCNCRNRQIRNCDDKDELQQVL